MATARAHAHITRPVGEVWPLVADPNGIVSWFPGLQACTYADGVRHVTTETGVEVDEEIVTNDAELRRFQYRLRPGPVPVEQHLATVDVLDDGAGGSIVVYSVDVAPDALGAAMQSTVAGAVAGLKVRAESLATT